MLLRPPCSSLFPYTTLFRSLSSDCGMHHGTSNAVLLPVVLEFNRAAAGGRMGDLSELFGGGDPAERVRELNRRLGIKPRLDRKSTRLNSSHRCISYAVFCLK